MTFVGEKPDYRDLPEYRLALETSELILKTAESMTWTQDWLWLRQGIQREATRLPQTLAEGYQSDLVAEWILGIGSCRNAVVMSDYIFTFMKGQSMLPAEKADPILAKLKQLLDGIMALSQRLRQELTARKSSS